MKKLFFLSILLVATVSPCFGAGLVISSQTGAPGETVQFTVSVQSAPKDVPAFVMDIHYDSHLLRFTSYSRGVLTENGYPMLIANEYRPGIIRFVGADPMSEGIVAGQSGPFLNMTFEVLRIGEGSISFGSLKNSLAHWPAKGGQFNSPEKKNDSGEAPPSNEEETTLKIENTSPPKATEGPSKSAAIALPGGGVQQAKGNSENPPGLLVAPTAPPVPRASLSQAISGDDPEDHSLIDTLAQDSSNGRAGQDTAFSPISQPASREVVSIKVKDSHQAKPAALHAHQDKSITAETEREPPSLPQDNGSMATRDILLFGVLFLILVVLILILVMLFLIYRKLHRIELNTRQEDSSNKSNIGPLKLISRRAG